ncbi:hypothetical protein H2201_002239 [Coniosporium apollinis]|uniref:Uncharacterized protein n=1 Tax=Coniosporium apollinis TaxID=61459 RepID=A0ABQ9NZA9_9PEZI|nr:hypothetical protein H2201_002239 [Coniosporium apollinis]
MQADNFSPSQHAPASMPHALLRMLRGRRGRSLLAVAAFALVALGFLWQPSSETLRKYPSLANYRLHYWQPTSDSSVSSDSNSQQNSSLLQSSNDTLIIEGTNTSAIFSNLSQKPIPSLHLLLLASTATPDLCKTVLSTFLLGYPPPTLINWKKEWDGEDADQERNAAKIRGVYDYLQDAKNNVADEDLVLVIDGYDVWFQLPSEVLIEEYQRLIAEANERSRRKYGPMDDKPWLPRFRHSIVFGADMVCWPNAENSTACRAVPDSPLPKNEHTGQTNTETLISGPKYLNSGAIMGPAEDLMALYEEAMRRPQYHLQHGADDQYVFAEIFGEQECTREFMYQSTRSAAARWKDWLSQRLGYSTPSTLTQTNLTLIENHRYEYRISLDYASTLFATFTASTPPSLAFTTHANSSTSLPRSLLNSAPPFATPPAADAATSIPSTTIPIHDHLDALPPPDTPWSALPLLTSSSGSIPAGIHFSTHPNNPATVAFTTTTINRTAIWTNLWYQPPSRALLRRYFRGHQGPAALLTASATLPTGPRGGHGGVWTDRGEWMGWSEVCGDWHEEVFGDGAGRWGHELKGIGEAEPKYNSEGKLVSGEGAETKEGIDWAGLAE